MPTIMAVVSMSAFMVFSLWLVDYC
jgi:preprotein translocase subunit SecE